MRSSSSFLLLRTAAALIARRASVAVTTTTQQRALFLSTSHLVNNNNKSTLLSASSAAPVAQMSSSISNAVVMQNVRLMSGGHAGFIPRDQVQERVLNLVKNFNKVDPAKVTSTSHFINDLGLDSLDAVELVMAVEEEFDLAIADAEAEKIVSVKDAIDYVATHPNAK